MDLDTSVNRMLRDMKQQGLIISDSDEEAKVFLRALWVVGYEEGYRERSFTLGRRIGQYTKSGHLVNSFRSISEAHRKTHFPERSLGDALARGHVTKQGWIWKYIIEDETKRKRQPSKGDRSNAYSGMVPESLQKKENDSQAENERIL